MKEPQLHTGLNLHSPHRYAFLLQSYCFAEELISGNQEVASGSILYITIPMRISNKIDITHPTKLNTAQQFDTAGNL